VIVPPLPSTSASAPIVIYPAFPLYEQAVPLEIKVAELGGHVLQEAIPAQAVMVILHSLLLRRRLRRSRPQDLRQTFATGMIDVGADLVTVQDMVDHANSATTARYDRRDDRARQAAATRIHFPSVATGSGSR